MTFGNTDPDPVDKIIVPWFALGFSILIAVVGPKYQGWFGGSLPALTQYYVALYPLWIVINALSLLVQFLVGNMRGGDGRLWKLLDAILSTVSVLSVLVGIVAMLLPEAHAIKFF